MAGDPARNCSRFPRFQRCPIVPLALLATLLGTSVVSGLVPAVNAEAILVGSILAAPPESTLVIVLIVTVGQVLAKLLLYGGGVGIAGSRAAEKAARASKLAESLGDRPVLLGSAFLASALFGLPPLYVMAIVAGIGRLPLPVFVVLCFVGRFVRFYTIAGVTDWF